MSTEAIQRAVDLCGTQSELAQRIRKHSGRETFSQQTVSYWLNRGVAVGPEWWNAIEAATDGQVTREQLRPDVFGTQPERAA